MGRKRQRGLFDSEDRMRESGAKDPPARSHEVVDAGIMESTSTPKIRSRVEHVFGDQHTGMHLTKIRTRRNPRAEFTIRLNTPAYNLRRPGFLLQRPGFATETSGRSMS